MLKFLEKPNSTPPLGHLDPFIKSAATRVETLEEDEKEEEGDVPAQEARERRRV